MPQPSISEYASPTHWPKVAASGAIFRDDGKLLIGLRGKDPTRLLWSLPGGHIEPGETARDAALREIREETGIEAEILGLTDINDVIVRNADGSLRAHYLLTIFFGRWLAGEPSAADDCLDARFVDVEEIGELDTTDRLMHFVALSRQKWTAFNRG